MDELPSSALALVSRLTRDRPTPDRPAVEAALTKILVAVDLPGRAFRWHEHVADACAYLAQHVLDALTNATQEPFDAAESVFDARWANGWPQLVAGCQIAAGASGKIESMQSLHRLLNSFRASAEVAAMECNFARAETALAGETEDDDLARDRIRRHRSDFAQLIQDFVVTLAVTGPSAGAAHVIAHEAVAAWESGGSLFWVRPDEIVIAGVAGQPISAGRAQ